MDALLNLREPGREPGAAAVQQHLDQCPHCQAELERLHQRVARIKSLPPLRPGRDRWPETAARFRAERARRRIRLAGVSGLAAAASVALALAIGRPTETTAPADPTTEQLQEAMIRSQALETALGAFDPDSRVLDGRTARMAHELEDRIARVDRELEVAELLRQQATEQQLLRLWRERVGLLDALVDVHVTRASNAGL
jgi:hypothetical protein